MSSTNLNLDVKSILNLNEKNNPFLSAPESKLLDEILNINSNFGSYTLLNHIFNAKQPIKVREFAALDSTRVNRNIPNVSVDEKWTAIGNTIYDTMASDPNIVTASKNNLLTSDTQNGYLKVIEVLCYQACTNYNTKYQIVTTPYFETYLKGTSSVFANLSIRSGLSYITLKSYIDMIRRKTRQIPNTDDRDVFMLFFTPYFIARYIISFIASSSEEENKTKPNSFVLQMCAMLGFRIYYIQIIMFLVQTSLRPGNLFRVINFEIARLTDQLDTTSATYHDFYTKLSQMITENSMQTEYIHNLSRKLELQKNNLEKAVDKDVKSKTSVQKSALEKYVWISVLIFVTLLSIGLLFLIYKNGNNTFALINYIVSGILIVAVVINLIIMAVRST